MKKLVNIVLIVVMTFMIFSIPAKIYAVDLSVDGIKNSADSFFSNTTAVDLPMDEDDVKDLGLELINLLTTAGIIISVGVALALGAKLVFSSVEEKAEYKEKLMPYIIGSFVTFAAFGIWKVVLALLQDSGI